MTRAGFAFAQARMQARLADRPTLSDWQLLESSHDLAHCLDLTSRMNLARNTARLAGVSDPHRIEQVLREEWRLQVGEITAWLPLVWRGAHHWVTSLPHLLRPAYPREDTGGPEWLHPDPDWPVELTQDDGLVRDAPKAWLDAWQKRLPDGSRKMETALAPFLDRYLGNQTGETMQDVAAHLTKLFRRQPQTPSASFAFLGLLALDFERLRGILTQRAAFADAPGGF